MPSLNWIGKDEVINYNPPFHILNQKYTFNAENSDNMIIKGDNLLALKALLPRFEGKIKCIYIDPPYNTGNENWVYNDNVNSKEIKKWLGEVVGKDDLSRHDKWLCMMLPRLKLLHRLLSDDGVIFISIDDNEMANLKLLCDEVFGANNFVATFKWMKTSTPPSLSKNVRRKMEVVFCYKKSEIKGLTSGITDGGDMPLLNATNKLGILEFPANSVSFKIADNLYKAGIYDRVQLLEDVNIENSTNINTLKLQGNFKWSQETLNDEIANNTKFIIKGLKFAIRYARDAEREKIPSDIISKLECSVGTNEDGKKEIKEIFDSANIFDYPKPSSLIVYLANLICDKNSIILDSFAGSGTTAHAVLELNKKDGGNRKFILVEMENYAENITAERVKRVIKGYGKEPKTTACGGDFSFYELGEKLLLENGNINENVATNKIKEYIYFSETKEKYEQNDSDFLGECNGVAYYFIYKKDEITTLDFEYLANIKKASAYVIYADICVLSNDTMMKYSITFKKIPRDIKKV